MSGQAARGLGIDRSRYQSLHTLLCLHRDHSPVRGERQVSM